MKPHRSRTLIAAALAAALLPTVARSQSLWHDDTSKPMFADKKATSVGDIITIVVSENTSTTKDNSKSTTKKTALDASVSSFLYSPTASSFLTKNGQLPAIKMGSQNDFAGGGSVNNSEKIIAQVAVRVVDVLPNKNLVIEGKRETAFSGEKQTVVLRGIVRTEDVAANNTVFSYNVADASIQVIGKGALSDNEKKGWFGRIWDKVSPF